MFTLRFSSDHSVSLKEGTRPVKQVFNYISEGTQLGTNFLHSFIKMSYLSFPARPSVTRFKGVMINERLFKMNCTNYNDKHFVTYYLIYLVT